MKDEEKKPSPGWVRPLSYILLLAAFGLLIFYDRFSAGLGIPAWVFQVGSVGCLIIGAVLFASVRQKVDRSSAYKDVFGPKPSDKDDPPR